MAPLRAILLLSLGFVLMAFSLPRGWEGHRIVVLAFPGALTDPVLRDFERSTGAEVELRPYGGAGDLLGPRGAALTEGVDVVLGAETLLLPLAFRERISPLDLAQLPNHIHVDGAALKGPAAALGVPYLAGVTGLAYRRDKVPVPPGRWADLLAPEAPWAGRVLLLRERRHALGVALKALGRSANEGEARIVTGAGRWLAGRAEVLGGLDSRDHIARLASGEIWFAQAHLGEVSASGDRRIGFVVPAEGGFLYADVAALGADAQDPALAYAFMDHLLHPLTARRLAATLGRPTPNRGALRRGGDGLALPIPRGAQRLSEGLGPVGPTSVAFDLAWEQVLHAVEDR